MINRTAYKITLKSKKYNNTYYKKNLIIFKILNSDNL